MRLALAKRHRTIYFFTIPEAPVNKHNPLVIHPSGLPLFQDGQWILEKLHWTGWGSSVAHAQGLSSSSNDKPNAEEGKRIITWAKVTLSKPVRFRGHEVYSCFRVKVPPPASYPDLCLQRSGGYVGLLPPGSGKPVGSGTTAPGPRRLSDFLSLDHKVWCVFSEFLREVNCGTEPEPPTRAARIDAHGRVSICSVLQLEIPPGGHVPLGCYQNWPSPAEHTPVLRYGEQTVFGGFRCSSATNGITCIEVDGTAKGKGFRINKDEAVRVTVGGASRAAHHHQQVERVRRHLIKGATSHVSLWAALGGKVRPFTHPECSRNCCAPPDPFPPPSTPATPRATQALSSCGRSGTLDWPG